VGTSGVSGRGVVGTWAVCCSSSVATTITIRVYTWIELVASVCGVWASSMVTSVVGARAISSGSSISATITITIYKWIGFVGEVTVMRTSVG